MNFHYLILTCVFCFVCAETPQYEEIKKWLHKEHLGIKNYCNELKDNMSKQLKDKKIKAELINKINEIEENERNEHNIAVKFLEKYQNACISEIIDARNMDCNL